MQYFTPVILNKKVPKFRACSTKIRGDYCLFCRDLLESAKRNKGVQLMFQISSDILALTSEALVLARAGKIAFANASARAILGADCVGKKLSAVFEPDITCAQASGFIADTVIADRRYLVRVSKQENMQVMFITSPTVQPIMLNDALLYSMRNTLMTMSVSAELCRSRAEDTDDAEMRAGIASLTQSYYRLTRTVANISAAKSILCGGLCFTPCMTDIAELCRSLAERTQFFLSEPEITVGTTQSMYAMADGALVEQLLLNLISNSVAHAKGCTRISINLIDTAESVILSISDNGCGIAGDMLGSVFARYVHTYELDTLGIGAGLGLTVVRGIAERHGGTLLLESRPEYGTTVRVSLKKSLMCRQS